MPGAGGSTLLCLDLVGERQRQLPADLEDQRVDPGLVDGSCRSPATGSGRPRRARRRGPRSRRPSAPPAPGADSADHAGKAAFAAATASATSSFEAAAARARRPRRAGPGRRPPARRRWTAPVRRCRAPSSPGPSCSACPSCGSPFSVSSVVLVGTPRRGPHAGVGGPGRRPRGAPKVRCLHLNPTSLLWPPPHGSQVNPALYCDAGHNADSPLGHCRARARARLDHI